MPGSRFSGHTKQQPSTLSELESIPFNRPFVAGRELFYISHAILNGNLAQRRPARSVARNTAEQEQSTDGL